MIENVNPVKTGGNGSGQQIAITSKNIYEDTPEEPSDQLSYSSIDESINKLKIPLADEYEIEKKSKTATNIVRTFYSNKIIESLEWLSKNHETSIDSTPYIQPLFENLKKYKDDHFADPYSSFISALYDALVFNDSWIKLKKEQFAHVIKIIIPLNNNQNLDYNTIDIAINKLDKLGLDTTPF